MKHSERFDRAIRALVKGFFNETLAKGTCTACAIGNIVAESMGFKLEPHHVHQHKTPNGGWVGLLCVYRDGVYSSGSIRLFYEDEIELLSLTGYSIEEIDRIEKAFENATEIPYTGYPLVEAFTGTRKTIIADQYKGLMAVVEVLCQIEGIEAAPIKEFFSYTPEFKPVKELA